jgi:integrase
VAPRSSARTVERYEMNLKTHIYGFIGDLYVSQITREHADQLVAKLRATNHNPVGTNLVLGVLKQIVSEAFKQEKILKYPFADYGKVKEPKRPDHFMSAEEIEKFLEANRNDPHYWLFVTAMNTGMRRGELAGLLWDRVDFEKGSIPITRLRDRGTFTGISLRPVRNCNEESGVYFDLSIFSILSRRAFISAFSCSSF